MLSSSRGMAIAVINVEQQWFPVRDLHKVSYHPTIKRVGDLQAPAPGSSWQLITAKKGKITPLSQYGHR